MAALGYFVTSRVQHGVICFEGPRFRCIEARLPFNSPSANLLSGSKRVVTFS